MIWVNSWKEFHLWFLFNPRRRFKQTHIIFWSVLVLSISTSNYVKTCGPLPARPIMPKASAAPKSRPRRAPGAAAKAKAKAKAGAKSRAKAKSTKRSQDDTEENLPAPVVKRPRKNWSDLNFDLRIHWVPKKSFILWCSMIQCFVAAWQKVTRNTYLVDKCWGWSLQSRTGFF